MQDMSEDMRACLERVFCQKWASIWGTPPVRHALTFMSWPYLMKCPSCTNRHRSLSCRAHTHVVNATLAHLTQLVLPSVQTSVTPTLNFAAACLVPALMMLPARHIIYTSVGSLSSWSRFSTSTLTWVRGMATLQRQQLTCQNTPPSLRS